MLSEFSFPKKGKDFMYTKILCIPIKSKFRMVNFYNSGFCGMKKVNLTFLKHRRYHVEGLFRTKYTVPCAKDLIT